MPMLELAVGGELVEVRARDRDAEALVVGLELTTRGLTTDADPERFRVEVPGPKVSEGAGEDERLRISVPATMFKLLAAEGELVDWQEAFHYKHLRVEGDSRVQRLLGQAIEPALTASVSKGAG